MAHIEPWCFHQFIPLPSISLPVDHLWYVGSKIPIDSEPWPLIINQTIHSNQGLCPLMTSAPSIWFSFIPIFISRLQNVEQSHLNWHIWQCPKFSIIRYFHLHYFISFLIHLLFHIRFLKQFYPIVDWFLNAQYNYAVGNVAVMSSFTLPVLHHNSTAKTVL